MIEGVAYGTGYASSKKHAKNEAGTITCNFRVATAQGKRAIWLSNISDKEFKFYIYVIKGGKGWFVRGGSHFQIKMFYFLHSENRMEKLSTQEEDRQFHLKLSVATLHLLLLYQYNLD